MALEWEVQNSRFKSLKQMNQLLNQLTCVMENFTPKRIDRTKLKKFATLTFHLEMNQSKKPWSLLINKLINSWSKSGPLPVTHQLTVQLKKSI
jgi:hypothetical protein